MFIIISIILTTTILLKANIPLLYYYNYICALFYTQIRIRISFGSRITGSNSRIKLLIAKEKA